MVQRDARAVEDRGIETLITIDPKTGIKLLPHWVAQPYTRPLLDVAGKKLTKENALETKDRTPAKGTL